jgi:NADP-dependent 3-hydroxy acid dehydrogenase YdfG
MVEPKSILITGAASGLGAALAKVYSRPGVDLFLCDITPDKLENVKSQCAELGARVHVRTQDVTHRQSTEDWVLECEGIRPLDLVLANAAISRGTS